MGQRGKIICQRSHGKIVLFLKKEKKKWNKNKTKLGIHFSCFDSVLFLRSFWWGWGNVRGCCVRGCCDLNLSPQDSCVDVLIPSISECDCVGDRVFKEVIKLNEVIGVGPDPVGLVSLWGEVSTQAHTGQDPVKTKRRRGPFISQGGRPQKKPAAPTHHDLGLLASRIVRK